jgi:FKBP-type peptidyl-prolyl cis-trans isomerase
MADRLEALARDVHTFAEEDADLARQMARDVRADHLAAQVETARLKEVEARVEEAERRRRAEVEARREIERREERETQARLAENARLAAGIQASPSDASTRDASEGPGIAFLAKRERARARAQNLPTLFDLDAMPDEVAGLRT